jgi:hypothetical protein
MERKSMWVQRLYMPLTPMTQQSAKKNKLNPLDTFGVVALNKKRKRK